MATAQRAEPDIPAARGLPTEPIMRPPAGTLTVMVTDDGQGSVACPRCGPGTELDDQEIVHATRPVIDTSLTPVIDPDAGLLWFLPVHPEPDTERPVTVAGYGEARIACRGCGATYQLPAGVHLTIDWNT